MCEARYDLVSDESDYYEDMNAYYDDLFIDKHGYSDISFNDIPKNIDNSFESTQNWYESNKSYHWFDQNGSIHLENQNGNNININNNNENNDDTSNNEKKYESDMDRHVKKTKSKNGNSVKNKKSIKDVKSKNFEMKLSMGNVNKFKKDKYKTNINLKGKQDKICSSVGKHI